MIKTVRIKPARPVMPVMKVVMKITRAAATCVMNTQLPLCLKERIKVIDKKTKGPQHRNNKILKKMSLLHYRFVYEEESEEELF